MKICLSALALGALVGVPECSAYAFSPVSGSSLCRWKGTQIPSSVVTLGMSNDGGDDFYADYDASKYKDIDSPQRNNDYNNDDRRNNSYNNDDRRNNSYNNNDRRNNNYNNNDRSSSNQRRSYEYTRDTSRDESNVNEQAVMESIRQRTDARSRGDYAKADSIREDLLRDHAVGIDDKSNSWRTGCSASGSGQKFGGGGVPSRQRGNDNNGRRSDRFGPNGHDYNMLEGPNTSKFTEDEVNVLLKERLQAKMSRNFNDADRIQAYLVDGGVFVHDRKKEWKADGIPFPTLDGGEQRERAPRRGQYSKSSHSSKDADDSQDSLIGRLVNERAKFKMMRQYEKADATRDGLEQKFGVTIDDRIQEWTIGGDFGPEHNAQRDLSDKIRTRGYIISESSENANLSSDDLQYIQTQVDARSEAKQNRDFDAADQIRDSLQEQFHVSINDKQKLWAIGGVFSELGHKPKGVYVRRGGGDLTEEEEAVIVQQLADRSQAKRDRDFDTADEIRGNLMRQFNVKVDDRSGEWHIDSSDYAMTGPNDGVLSEEKVQLVASMLKNRYSLKQNQEYEEADAIRDNLKDNFGITIDDRTKEWSINAELVEENYDSTVTHGANDDEKLEDDIDDALEDMFNDDNDGKIEDEVEDINDDAEELSVSADNQEESDTEMSEEELSKLTVPLLKEKLKIVGLKVSGKKSELIARLLSSSSQ